MFRLFGAFLPLVVGNHFRPFHSEKRIVTWPVRLLPFGYWYYTGGGGHTTIAVPRRSPKTMSLSSVTTEQANLLIEGKARVTQLRRGCVCNLVSARHCAKLVSLSRDGEDALRQDVRLRLSQCEFRSMHDPFVRIVRNSLGEWCCEWWWLPV
jgi:hypothetical protein